MEAIKSVATRQLTSGSSSAELELPPHSDVTLRCDDGMEFKAHMGVLAAACGVFHDLFDSTGGGALAAHDDLALLQKACCKCKVVATTWEKNPTPAGGGRRSSAACFRTGLQPHAFGPLACLKRFAA